MFKQFVRRLSKSVVFDIDGVLIKGHGAIPEARQSLELLDKHKIPFMMLTNGGGVREKDRLDYLGNLIGYKFKPHQLVLSHTPMKELASQYNRVLVVGGDGDKSRYSALDYGFKQVVMPIDLVKWNPFISPFHRYTQQDLQQYAKPFANDPIDAILVFCDPRDMSTDLQVIADYLVSKEGVYGTRRSEHGPAPSVPIYFLNNDFYWSNEFSVPRFGQGVFRIVVESIYRSMSGYELPYTMYGKPFARQYEFCARLVDGDRIFMVGDNPASDIEGANGFGWESCLLRTGVYKDGDKLSDLQTPSLGIFDNVLHAVETIASYKA